MCVSARHDRLPSALFRSLALAFFAVRCAELFSVRVAQNPDADNNLDGRPIISAWFRSG